jgi:hypothetical protein
MTDTNPSGASSAPAADTSAPAASAETPAGTFGSTRGSGLARGKRHTGAPAPTADTSAPADFKPASIEVITTKSEYVNPFASPEPENAPAAEPVKIESIAAEPAPAAAPEAFALRSAPVVQHPPAPVHEPVAEEAPAEKREIEILPPAEDVRTSVSWESPSAAPAASAERPQTESRPVFRPARREDRNSGPRAEGAENPSEIRPAQGSEDGPREPRQPRDPRMARQPRDPRDVRQPRDPREAREPREPRSQDKYGRQPRDPRDYEESPRQREAAAPAAVAPAPKGFFGWLKSLLGGGAKPAPAPAAREGYSEHPSEGLHRRRRHRGGRGHGGPSGPGGPQGFRGEGSPQGGEREARGGDRAGGSRRRRSRGGRDRDRDRGPRSEGQQGGGAI